MYKRQDQDLASAIVFAFFVIGFVVMLFYYHIKQQKLLCFKNRDIAIKSAENKNFDIAICDDGLQEKKINYDISIACFNSTYTIGNGFLISKNLNNKKILI